MHVINSLEGKGAKVLFLAMFVGGARLNEEVTGDMLMILDCNLLWPL